MSNSGEAQVGRSRWLLWLPVLEREERLNLFEHFRIIGSWNADFVVMMGLSTALAAFGLLNNSSPAVIGAMLVAPLMSPLLGAGFALTQGNLTLFRDCMKAMAYGVVVSVLVSLIIGMITPGYDPTTELEARGRVNLLDMAIALLSGMAAAFAMARPNLAATLSGVAIAAALVPPLAAVGVAVASGDFVLAGLSGVLFITNVTAIILGAAFVFRLVGAQGPQDDSASPLWARRAQIGLVLATVVLVIPLAERFESQIEAGQLRPVGYPLAIDVRKVVRERVDAQPGVAIVFMGRYSTAPQAGAQIILAAADPLPRDFIPDLESAIRSHMGDHAPVRVVVLQAAHGVPLEPAATTGSQS